MGATTTYFSGSYFLTEDLLRTITLLIFHYILTVGMHVCTEFGQYFSAATAELYMHVKRDYVRFIP